MRDTRAINQFLVTSGHRISDNPAVSPDLCLDPPAMKEAIRQELSRLVELTAPKGGGASHGLYRIAAGRIDLFPASELVVAEWRLFVVEDRVTGDAGLLVQGALPIPLPGAAPLGMSMQFVPLLWDGLAALKNLILEDDPGSTVFPVARGTLSRSSIGVGARFTTLHWPAVAWVMKELGLSLTANQNSIPRELVYDVDAMLEGRLAHVPFPFIGGAVPEGHQGQSVEGMTHAAVIAYLKTGLHHRRIPWGFNADHQPIGGRFDAIEEELARGCAFASYITFDLSPELALTPPLSSGHEVEEAFSALSEPLLFSRVLARLRPLGLGVEPAQARRLFVTLLPAMRKLKRRDEAYTRVRRELFTTAIGRRYFRELSIDELPGRTSAETLAFCLALAEAMGVEFDYVAPAIGFQKNFPFEDNEELRKIVTSLYRVARAFGVSIGFHSGSGKSAENYRVAGEVTRQALEIKTSGRYTYEMGVALWRSRNESDQALWRDWYAFTRELAVEGAFSEDPVRQKFARDFIRHALAFEGIDEGRAFDSSESLRAALSALPLSPDHMYFFEYNFLFVLAAGGNPGALGDHGVAGYAQRARFYRVSDEARFLYAKGVASYLLFLVEETGLSDASRVAAARERLLALPDHDAFERDLVV
ncbi:MAG: hypothetical protein DIJKHBIC_00664 [Thermoanaerobaculia bacterium]|nr:hypothetical protein [Thermoanaerobaculia bacterium]